MAPRAALSDPDRANNKARSHSLPLAPGSQTFRIEKLVVKTTEPRMFKMEIRPQMTASFRFTKDAARKLKAFLAGVEMSGERLPQNMNEAINAALSTLHSRYVGETLSLAQEDMRSSLTSIKQSSNALSYVEYFYLVTCAKECAASSQAPRVSWRILQAVLRMTRDFTSLQMNTMNA
ncbi:hypothetical protein WOB59_00330 [Methylocystis sp. IM4]|uniref:hypothetical protein n=1 Tax=Methylocystis sp. IM4 TaxID=3136560 RepID=UPI00311A8DBD